MRISCKTMGVTSFGRHTRPGCNLGYCRDLFFVLNDVDLYIVCFSWTLGDARGLGLNCAYDPLVPRLYAVHKTMPSMWIYLLCVRVLFLMGSRDLDAQIWALRRHHGHVGSMLDSDWSRKKLLRCDWSVPTVASITTAVHAVHTGSFSFSNAGSCSSSHGHPTRFFLNNGLLGSS